MWATLKKRLCDPRKNLPIHSFKCVQVHVKTRYNVTFRL